MLLLPRAVVGVDRPKEAEAFEGFGLEGVLEKHRVFAGAEDRDAYASPEEGDVVEAVLEDFMDRLIFEYSLNKSPSIKLVCLAAPITSSLSAGVKERNHKGSVTCWGKADASNLVSRRFNINSPRSMVVVSCVECI